MTESYIEQAFVKYAKTYKCKAVKFTDVAQRGAPDRIIFCPNGALFFIEFKKKGGRVSKHQKKYHSWLRNNNFIVYICYSLKEAKQALEEFLNEV